MLDAARSPMHLRPLIAALTALPLLVGAAAWVGAPRAASAQDRPPPTSQPGTSQPSSLPSIDAVLARMARIEGLHCRFEEEKRIALLSSPVRSEGTIDFARGTGASPRMARRTLRPSPQIVLIDGAELRMSDGRTSSRIDLASQPVVRSFVDSFLQLLVGNRAALERTYTLSLEAGEGEGGWALLLRPRAAPLSSFLREIRFEGRGEALTRMVMTEVSGDVTTTRFTDVDARHRYDAAEAARAFSLSL